MNLLPATTLSGDNRIHVADALDLLRSLPNNSADLVLTDPPYEMTKRGRSCRPNWMPNSMGDNVFDGELPDTSAWISEVYRVLKNRTHFYVFVGINDITSYLSIAQSVGFRLHNIISMIKDTGMPNRWYYKQTELVLFFRKGQAKPINDYTSRDNVRVIMPTLKNGKQHITQKPLDFITQLVTNSTQYDELVLDPFVGSGTTAVACVNTGRRFICGDQSAEYVAIARERVRKAQTEARQLELIA